LSVVASPAACPEGQASFFLGPRFFAQLETQSSAFQIASNISSGSSAPCVNWAVIELLADRLGATRTHELVAGFAWRDLEIALQRREVRSPRRTESAAFPPRPVHQQMHDSSIRQSQPLSNHRVLGASDRELAHISKIAEFPSRRRRASHSAQRSCGMARSVAAGCSPIGF